MGKCHKHNTKKVAKSEDVILYDSIYINLKIKIKLINGNI